MTPIAAAAAAAGSDFEALLQKRFTPTDLMQGDNLDRIERIAERLASGRMTVPEYLRGNPGDCMAIAMQAMLWNMDPFVVAQKTHIVSGRLGYEAQLVNAVVMASGAIRGSFRYEYRGEAQALECRVGAVLRGEQDITWGEWLASSQVTTKNSPLWKVNPRQQIGYLQVKNWARAFCPGAILGVYTVDELEDSAPLANMPRSESAAPAPAARTELPPYDPAAFEKNLPQWRSVIESGRKTAVDLLAMVSTKGTLTAEQRAEILALGAPAPAEQPVDDFVADMNAAEAQQ
jgi:hypothetical protein